MKTVKDMIDYHKDRQSGDWTEWRMIEVAIDAGNYAEAIETFDDAEKVLIVLRSIGQKIAEDDGNVIVSREWFDRQGVSKTTASTVSSGPVTCAGCGNKLVCLLCDLPNHTIVGNDNLERLSLATSAVLNTYALQWNDGSK